MRIYIRDEKIKQTGSPFYPVAVPVIAAGAAFKYSLSESAELAGSDKYAPLDWIEIVNNDVVSIEVWVGLGKFIVLPSTIRTIDNNWYDQFSVKNLDATTATTADKINITSRREPITWDKLARRMKL